MDRVTLSSLMGNIVVIGLDGEIRTLEEGQLPQPGELIIDEVSDTSELVIEQVTPQGSSINVTDDITALIEAIASGEDPTELGEEFDPAAGEGNGSSPQNTGAIDRTGAELLASTNFETVGTDGTGFSSTQVETLLDIFQIQPPEPTAISVPATVIVQEISSPTVNEGDLVSFDVTLNQPTEDNINITFSLFDQTATGGSTDESGSDYVNESVLITFSDDTTEEISVDDNGIFTVSVPLGENGFTVSLDSINDSIFEGPETFTLSGNTEEQSTPATGIATIVDDGSGPGLSPDDDRPTVTMSDAGTINEGELASFKVSLSNPSATDVEVELSLNLGDTEAGDLGTLEYNTGSGWVTVPNDGVVTVPAGQTEFDVRIASIDDAVYEGTEDFSVTVTGIGAVQGSDTGTATIVDDSSGPGPDPDDDRPSVAITDAGTINEGETANFKVTLSNASESSVQVELGLNLGDTEAGDLGTLEYNTGSGWVTVPNDGMVTVPAGQTQFDVRIASIDDAVYEGPEDFSVTVTGIGAVQGSDTGTATIVDDGSGPGPDPDDDRPSVTITDAGTINEGDTANFKVTLSNASEFSVQVELGLNLGDTEAGDLGTLEYNTGSGWVTVPNDGVLTVPAGQTEFDVRIASIDDAVYEGSEDFSVTVTGIGAVEGSDTGTATIVDDGTGPGPDPDDDRPNVTITDAGIINEGETANFKVTLSNASESSVQVELGLNLGDTEAGDLGTLEYNTGSGWVTVPNDGVLTVPAGQTEFDVRIASIDDAVYEGSEDFSVTVTGIGAVEGSDTGTATIVDDGTGPGPDPDDDRPSVTINDAGTINEGETANFKVTLSNASESTVQVELGLNLGDTEVGDLGILEYSTGSGWFTVPNDGVVTVPAGQTEFDVRIASVDDAVYEGPEDFSVTVTGIGAVQGSDTGTATIVDDSTGPGPDPDDDRPSVTITDAGTINEGETANFKVTLSNASEAETQVELGLNLGDTEVGDLGTLEYNTGSGWVTVPNDGVLTVPAGQTEFDVRIASIDDAVYEGSEDFSVTVTGIGAVEGSDTGTATIVDDGTGPGPDPDDDRPSVTITDAGIINEGDTANFKVTLSNASESTVQVELGLNLSDTEVGDLGTLEYNTGSGWVAVPNDGVVTVPVGQTEFDVRIASIDDAVYEGPEDFSVTVTGIGAVQGSDTGTATIVDDGTGPGPDPDDDRPNVYIVEDSVGVNEGTDAVYTVRLSAAADIDVTVRLNTSTDGSNTAEADDIGSFVVTLADGVTVVNANSDGTYTIPAGENELKVTVPTTDDGVYEGDETFTVAVQGDTGVLGSDSALGIIYDGGNGPGPDPDDDRPSVYIVEDSVGVNEGTEAVYTVRLLEAADIDVTVRLSTSTGGNNTAEPGDIGAIKLTLSDGVTVVTANSDGTYTIPAGETDLKLFVPTTDDDVYEGDETFTVAVQGATGVLGTDTALGIIYDGGNGPGPDPDDDRPTVSISDAGIVDEGDIATFTVSLSNASEGTVQVQLTLNPDETEVDDLGSLEYNTGAGWVAVPVDGIVTVPAMLTEFDVRIATIDDEVYEGPEDFSVTVTGLGAVQGTDTGLATIVDDGTKTDDDRPTVSISDAGTIDEGSFATFTVSLSNASEAALQVQLTLNLDETEVGDLGTLEYNTGSGWVSVPVSGIVTVPAGMTEFDLRIESIDDGVYEGPEDFSVTVTGLGAVQGSDTGLATIVDNSPPTARDFIISLDVQNGIFPVQDVEFDGITTSGEQRVEDLEDDAVTANDDDILIQVVSLPEHGELYYVDGNGQEVIIDETTQFPENTEVKYRLTEDFFEEQSFDSADLLEEQGKDILVGSYTPPNSNLTFTGGQITTIGNSIIFDSDAQISVDFANQQVGLVVVSPNETGQGDEISTGEYITLELDEDLSANEAKLNLASLNDRFNSGGAWLTAYIFLNGALVDVQQFYSTDITYTSNHEGSITVALANGSFDEIRLTPETDSASDKAGFTLVGTEITSFTDVNDDFTYQAIDTDGAVSNEATVAVDFENVTVDAVTALGYQTMALNSDLNLVMGTDGDDILVGTEGNDLIIGGLGNDILTGGEGDDVFKWTEMQSATDTVTDFSDGDQLDFTDVFDDMSGTDISALLDDLGSGDYRGSVDDISVEVTESGGNSTLTINKDGQQLEVNFDGASAADIANSLISNLDQLRE
ncbi:Calx-beta domain-containing protein [Vibrio antiquarius]|uniref:Calx-beta domain-containing protein n=1 Tax=Vibrio antiquarius (strain Ex25) TaxID=150340 RepID=UPI00265D3868|nr:Calx-beta domain-containing protein [Vibrio antiquarius]MCS0046708.1 calcium-binding protein [Vibrio antiquarius]